MRIRMLVWVSLLALAAACSDTTAKLTPAQEQRFTDEGIVRRADDLVFRYTHDANRRDAGWEDRNASIVITRQSVLIHKNEKIGLEITPSSRRYYGVRRDGQRVRISAGSGRSTESWSFLAPEDAAGWASDIRAVIQNSKSSAND